MREIVLSWYATLNSLFVALEGPIRALVGGTEGSIFTAVLLGVLGAASPCQMSTNATSIAYVMGGGGRRGWSFGAPTAAYIGGKVLVYSGIGVLAVLMGQGLQAVAVPTVVVTRKVMGPLMILIGLAMIGVWRPRLAFGHRLSARLRQRTGGEGSVGAFLLGVAFSFAFCPTLALLLFAFVLPMAVASPAGPLYPAAFALGTTLPLMVTAVVLAVGSGTPRLADRLVSWEPALRRIAGLVFLLAGTNDTILYWFL